jgi:hypothetical protein
MDQLNVYHHLRMRANQPPKTLCSDLEYWMMEKAPKVDDTKKIKCPARP